MNKTKIQEQIEKMVTNGVGIRPVNVEAKKQAETVLQKHNDTEWDLQRRLGQYECASSGVPSWGPSSDGWCEFRKAYSEAQNQQRDYENRLFGKLKAKFGYGPMSVAKTADDVDVSIKGERERQRRAIAELYEALRSQSYAINARLGSKQAYHF